VRVFKSSITSTFGRRERGRVVEVVRARGFQSRHSSLLYNSTRRREREREREYFTRENKRSRRRRNSAKTLPFELSFVGQSEEKKEAKCIERGPSGSQKRKSLLSSNATISSSFFRARAIYTHTVLSRSSNTLPHTHAVRTRDDENGKKRGWSRRSFSLVVLCESESQGERVVCYFSQRVRRSRAVGEI